MSPQINSQGPLSDQLRLDVAGKSNIALIAYKPSGPSGQILSYLPSEKWDKRQDAETSDMGIFDQRQVNGMHC